ncbi:MAG TPA: hypothetical protein PK059_13050, partial [Cyclobacteriaceae bacterium]|nr:hypothetical protein [Cyclobacteriaceae bacterium]
MGGTFPVADNSTFTITIRASFTTNVIDNQQFQVKVAGATTAAGTSSTYAAPDAGGATASTAGDNNRIEVTATKLTITTNLTSPLLPAVNIGSQQALPVVKALDGFNNLDLDYASPVNLSAAITFSPVTLSSDNPAPNAGVYTFPAGFQYSQTGNGTLTMSSGTLTGVISSPVTVQAGTATAIAAGAAAPATISSLINTAGAAVAAFNFDVIDDKTPVAATNNDGLPTLISQIVITANPTFNTITNWSQALAGAILADGGGHSMTVLAGPAITANSITFSGIPNSVNTLGYVPDDGTQNYTLKIFLKSSLGGTLPSTIDGLKFQFEVLSSNILTVANSTNIIGAQSVNSGNNDAVTVVATQLRFTYPAGPANVSLNTNFPGVTLEATDVNFNRDVDFTGANATITAFSNTSSRTTANGPTVGTSQFASGVFAFASNFQYTSGSNGDDVTLSVKAGTGTNCGVNALCISPVTTPASPTITLLSSFESSIIGDPTSTSLTTLDYINHQEATNIQNTSTSLEIGRALLVDGSRVNYSYGPALITTGTDIDGLPNQDLDGATTNLTSVTIRLTNPSNLRRIALYSGGVEIAGTEVDVTAIGAITSSTPSYDFVFTGAPLLTAPDDSQKDFSVRVSFRSNAADVRDHDLIQLTVIAATVSAGSDFYPGAGYVAGQPAGSLQSPPTVNHIDVVATKLDFTTQPAAFAGINEPVTAGIVEARDANNIRDLDHNFVASVSVVAAPPVATVNGTFNFIQGVLNMAGLITYGSTGDGTLTVTSNGLTSASGIQCSHVDVIHVTTVRQDGGPGGVPSGSSVNLLAGSANRVLFGFTFKAPYTISGTPKITRFTIGFNTSVTPILSNIKIYESTTGSYLGSTQITPTDVTQPNSQSVQVDLS